MKVIPEGCLEELAFVYGDACRERLTVLANEAPSDADVDELRNRAIEETYQDQFANSGVPIGSLRFNSR